MSDFWDDLTGEIEDDEDEEEEVVGTATAGLIDALKSMKGDFMDMLESMAHQTPQFKEAQSFLKSGLRYIVEQYTEEDDDGDEILVTDEGTPHCAIVDAVLLRVAQDDEMKAVLNAMDDGDDMEDVFIALKDLCHHVLHLGMAVGIGEVIEEGRLE